MIVCCISQLFKIEYIYYLYLLKIKLKVKSHYILSVDTRHLSARAYSFKIV